MKFRPLECFSISSPWFFVKRNRNVMSCVGIFSNSLFQIKDSHFWSSSWILNLLSCSCRFFFTHWCWFSKILSKVIELGFFSATIGLFKLYRSISSNFILSCDRWSSQDRNIFFHKYICISFQRTFHLNWNFLILNLSWRKPAGKTFL